MATPATASSAAPVASPCQHWWTLCDKLFTTQPDCVNTTLIVLAQMVLGFLWYSFIFGKPWAYWNSADKGVKRIEQWTHRYGMLVCFTAGILSSLVRILTVDVFATMVKADTLCLYLEIGAFVGCLVCTTFHHYFWSQKPILLLFIDVGHDFACSVLAAYLAFQLKGKTLW